MDAAVSRQRLVATLQLAYSGERAAGYAYRGHWRSVSDPGERSRIQEIEAEEWHHRQLVGELLRQLGARPLGWRELRAIVLGRALQLGCHLVPWFLPMYGAGRLESGNVGEYEDAARYARDAGRSEMIDCLLTMAEVEWEHERYFRERIAGHPWTRVFKPWRRPAPKPTIPAGYAGAGGSPSASADRGAVG